ncbi:MAG: glycosyltransferase, partial [Gammaproteobacteria bacterium]|nr:glycosyltransferase [Gammaproteobacteria bacterium]
FEHSAGEKDWRWFEDNLTYDNAVLPWALFAAYRRLGQERLLGSARESLEFLDQVTFRDGFFRPVGCKGWLARGAEPARYDEQPIEACAATLAHLEAYEATSDEAMLELARRSFAWYLGENSHRECLIDEETGGCCDGITPGGLNRNQGAESIVGYCIASLALEKHDAPAGGKRRPCSAR